MRNLRPSLIPTERLTGETISFLRKYEPVKGYWLADSGGKDSGVCRALCQMAGVKYVSGYTNTGIDPPELVSHIKRHHPETLLIRPERNFYQGVSEKCPPLPNSRWCCEELKERVGLKIKRGFPIHIVGVRAEESRKRARKAKVDIHQRTMIVTIKPIFHWSEWHIWEFITNHNVPYCKLYDEGFDRLGCVVCPMMFHRNQGKLDQHRNRWPGKFRAFERACRQWYERKGFKDCPHGSFEKYMEALYRGFEKPKSNQPLDQTAQAPLFS